MAFYVLKALVGLMEKGPVRLLALPAIVNIDIGPAMLTSPLLHKKPGRLQHSPAQPSLQEYQLLNPWVGPVQLIPTTCQNPLLPSFPCLLKLWIFTLYSLLRRGGTRNPARESILRAGGKPSRLNLLHVDAPGNGNLEQHRAGSGANNAGAVDGGEKAGFQESGARRGGAG